MIYLLQHSVIESAKRFPNKEAFRFGNESLTYSELKDKMNQLANRLHRLGLKKGDRVGIYLNRSLETAFAIYGILTAGGVYVPLDPKAPIERTTFLLEDCGIEILISGKNQLRNLNKIISKPTTVNSLVGVQNVEGYSSHSWKDLSKESKDFSCPFSVLEEDLAYIMYTSGSTGNPKGIMHTHYSGLSYANLTALTYQITDQDRIGNHAPIYFDISLLGYFTAPLVGATTCIASDAQTVFPASLSEFIEKENLTIWYSVPLALIQLQEKGLLESRVFDKLRWILYAGEPCPPQCLKYLMTLILQAQFANIYGPAETNQCTHYEIEAVPATDDPIPLGNIWDNTEMVIIDSDEQIMEGPAVGQLCIRSATMMKGYWQNPELTEKSFYLKKNNTGGFDTFYKTGDQVEFDEKGLLHFKGRIDHQIKIRGYRVELNAVELALANHPTVSEAAVFTTKKGDQPIEIHGAVILKPSLKIAEKELMSFLKKKLSVYAVPSTLSIVESFPRTGSGKVKRSELKKMLTKEI